MKSFLDIDMFQNTAEQALDKANIRELLEYDRYCRDYDHYDQELKCFSPQSRVRITWYDGDGREFVRTTAKRAAKSPNKNGIYSPKHRINDTIIWLHGDKAVAEVVCTMRSPREKIQGQELDFNTDAKLLYQVQKEDGVWRIKGLDCIYERDWFNLVTPGTTFTAPSNIDDYRESYKWLSWRLESMGLSASQNLPGGDRPDLVNKLYAEVSAWVFADDKQEAKD